MTSMHPGVPYRHFDSADPALWTRLHRWTPAEALSGPGRTEKRRELFMAYNIADRRVFLAGLPDNAARVIAISNVFGPNLLPEDIAEFLVDIGHWMDADQVKAVLDSAPTDDGLGGSGPSGTQMSAADRVRDQLDAAAEADTQAARWSGGHADPSRPLAAVRDAQVASGRAVLAVAGEMPATRAEIGQVAAAVRELTKTLDSVLGELCSRVTEVERTLDAGVSELVGEVSEVCTELGEIGAVLQHAPEPDGWMPVRPRRRRWLPGGGR